MTKINEILTSIILYCLISYLLILPDLSYSLLFAIIGSQINIIFPTNYKHTLITLIPISILSICYPAIFIPLSIGYLSSIFISLLSKSGVKLFYPITMTTFTGPKNYLENNTKKDHATTIFLITLALTVLLFSFNGSQVISSISQDNNLSEYFNHDDMNFDSNSNAIQYINIDSSKCNNKNITTIKTENSTTTLIKDL